MLDSADAAFKGTCVLILDEQKHLLQWIYGLFALRPHSLSIAWARPPVYYSMLQDIHCWPVEESASLKWVMIRWFASFVCSCKHLASEHHRCRHARDVNASKNNPFKADDKDEKTTVDGECMHYISFCDVFRIQAQTLKKCHQFRDLQSGTLPKIVMVQLLHLFPTSVCWSTFFRHRLEVKVRTWQNM